MAEHAVTFVASAVAGELISRVFSWLAQRHGKDAATSEKLQQLEMLLIKINSAVEVSEKRTIESSSMLQWRDKLKEAALQGVEVLASFTKQVKDAEETSNANGDKQQGEAAPSSTAAPTADIGPLSLTRNSLSTMLQEQGICSARKILSLGVNDNMERLNRTLGRLEKLSPDIREFIILLHHEGLPEVDKARCSTSLSAKVHGPTKKMMKTKQKKRIKHSNTHTSNPSSEPGLFSFSPPEEEQVELQAPPPRLHLNLSGCEPAHLPYSAWDSALSHKERQFKLLQDRFEAAFAEIFKAVYLADSHDLEDLEWLTYWAGILRVAKEQGRDVIGSTSAHKISNMNDKEPEMDCDQEEDELATLVHRLEGLARHVEYFNELVYLCPTR